MSIIAKAHILNSIWLFNFTWFIDAKMVSAESYSRRLQKEEAKKKIKSLLFMNFIAINFLFVRCNRELQIGFGKICAAPDSSQFHRQITSWACKRYFSFAEVNSEEHARETCNWTNYSWSSDAEQSFSCPLCLLIWIALYKPFVECYGKNCLHSRANGKLHGKIIKLWRYVQCRSLLNYA